MIRDHEQNTHVVSPLEEPPLSAERNYKDIICTILCLISLCGIYAMYLFGMVSLIIFDLHSIKEDDSDIPCASVKPYVWTCTIIDIVATFLYPVLLLLSPTCICLLSHQMPFSINYSCLKKYACGSVIMLITLSAGTNIILKGYCLILYII